MEDKFILIGLDDENSKYIAEVLKNKTCKKILDFLAETKEASEKDISNALKIPLNTTEYNLKKLIKSRLVEKTKNFFWSIKGKKIPMYRLAKKHIIISPNKQPNINFLKQILPVALISGAIMVFIKYIFQSSLLVSKKGLNQSIEMTASQALDKSTSQISFIEKILNMPYWSFFLIGMILSILVFIIYKKIKVKK